MTEKNIFNFSDYILMLGSRMSEKWLVESVKTTKEHFILYDRL